MYQENSVLAEVSRSSILTRKVRWLGYRDRESGHTLGVAFGFRVFQVERIAQRFQGDIVGALKTAHGGLQLIGTGWTKDSRFV